MHRTTATLMLITLVVGAVALPPVGTALAATSPPSQTSHAAPSSPDQSAVTAGGVLDTRDNDDDALANDSNTTDGMNDSEPNDVPAVSPGARLAGIIGVQQAEVRGEIASRTFGIRVARAANNDSRARVVAEQVNAIDGQLEALKNRKEALREARRAGNLTTDEYRARLAATTAEARTIEHLANRSRNASQELPRDILERNGVNVDAILRLKQNARNLTGPEVARIARSIAGPHVGRSIARRGPPVDIGPPEHAGPPDDRGRPGDREAENETTRQRGPPEDVPGRQAAGNESERRGPDSENDSERGRDGGEADESDATEERSGDSRDREAEERGNDGRDNPNQDSSKRDDAGSSQRDRGDGNPGNNGRERSR